MGTRRAVIGGAGAIVLTALGYRAWDRGVFAPADGAAFQPWRDWQSGDGVTRPLHSAILAANPHDTQPWLFGAKGNQIGLFADRARNLGTFDPYRREMHLGLGCALANLELAASKLGYAQTLRVTGGTLALSPPNTPNLVATIQLDPIERSDITPMDARLFEAIAHRHTNRGPYTDQPVSQALLDSFSIANLSTDAKIVFLTGKRAAMRDIIISATQDIIADPQMSADSAHWFRTGRTEIEGHRDGVTTDTAGLSPLMTVAAKILPDQNARSADGYWLNMTRDTQTATAPMFGMILVRDRFDIGQTLSAGKVWQRLHLDAVSQGIAAQPMNQPVEMVDRNQMLGRTDIYKLALAKLAGMPGWEPTFTFRMGYAQREAGPSPRRPLSDVLRA